MPNGAVAVMSGVWTPFGVVRGEHRVDEDEESVLPAARSDQAPRWRAWPLLCDGSHHRRGLSLGYMYRENPDAPNDSGWRFLAGDESDEYIGNPDNLALYDVNIIANYDPDVIRLLDSPFGSAFVRDPRTRTFTAYRRPRRR